MSLKARTVNWTTLALATGGGLGMSPVAPGTVGSLGGLLLVWGLQTLVLTGAWQVAIFVALALIGIPICERASQLFGRHDPGAIVYDEIIALIVVFALVPITWTTAAVGFLAFRLFDVWKPWPVSRLEQLPGGTGIMADDIAAGGYAFVVLTVFHRFA